ncbi:hypothetical protein J5N97_003525 [Dioscorea zingiberensis]|uniref:Uncharacterized protein n=1 Tax=Dioscorea zingiberensis TaxID=325984 RepID=A0A9D5D5P0_9LILI|nr:hypothetical protein J5N97_003525 [Dioscorea zingiberensis]
MCFTMIFKKFSALMTFSTCIHVLALNRFCTTGLTFPPRALKEYAGSLSIHMEGYGIATHGEYYPKVRGRYGRCYFSDAGLLHQSN